MNNAVNSSIDRAAAYGDGLFETIAIRDKEPRFWPLHSERLQTGCARLGLPCPTPDELLAKLETAIGAAGIATDFATAKLTVSAGTAGRGYQRDPNADPIVRISLHAAKLLPAQHYRSGISTRLCTTHLGVQPLLAGIKTLNRLEQVLARAEWNDENIFEGLMLDTDGRLICGTMSNVFIVKKSVLITPAITRCGVSGIMRRHLINLLQDKQGVECDVRDVAADELTTADEVFLTNSQFGVIPVRACTSLHWAVGPITRRAQTIAGDNGVPECSQ
jgi:4-amino-4-deoxychorismate lyase